MNVAIVNRQRTKKIDARFLKQVAAELFAELEITSAQIGIMLVGAKKMAQVNRQFLGHEGSTDVITFDHSSANSQLPSPNSPIYGELFICVDEAVAQAKEFKTDWQSELVRYLVHGVLHLLGYDDLQPDLRRAMKREENRLLRRLEIRFALAQLSRTVKMAA